MQKSMSSLISITLIFIALVVGVYIGRNSAGTTVSIDTSAPKGSSVSSESTSPSTRGKVNINTASIDELTILPGIGPAKAARIVAFREEYSQFTRIEDLLYIDGFGYTTIEELRPYITVGG